MAVLRVHVDGKDVYFKRKVWGRNGSAVVLSANPNWRSFPGPEDYVWRAEEPPILLVRIEGGSLHLYGDGPSMWKAPAGPFPVTVVFHDVDISTLARMFEKPQDFGLRSVCKWPLKEPPVEPVDF